MLKVFNYVMAITSSYSCIYTLISLIRTNSKFQGLQTQSKLFAPHCQIGQTRRFWEYVNMMFNKPDLERIKRFGPDRTCAEWVLRNGGKVVWVGGKVLSDYNLLPRETVSVPKISEIDATNCGISHYGFPHLSNIIYF